MYPSSRNRLLVPITIRRQSGARTTRQRKHKFTTHHPPRATQQTPSKTKGIFQHAQIFIIYYSSAGQATAQHRPSSGCGNNKLDSDRSKQARVSGATPKRPFRTHSKTDENGGGRPRGQKRKRPRPRHIRPGIRLSIDDSNNNDNNDNNDGAAAGPDALAAPAHVKTARRGAGRRTACALD